MGVAKVDYLVHNSCEKLKQIYISRIFGRGCDNDITVRICNHLIRKVVLAKNT